MDFRSLVEGKKQDTAKSSPVRQNKVDIRPDERGGRVRCAPIYRVFRWLGPFPTHD